MNDENERLKLAREAARFATASDAAQAMAIPEPTYLGHENGSRGFSRKAKKYARFFGVSLEWLLTGKGDMFGKSRHIPVDGFVGAGAVVEFRRNTPGLDAPDEVVLPVDGMVAALLVRGDSMYPRVLDGEFVLYDPRPLRPELLAGEYAIVERLDGGKQVKLLKPSGRPDHWVLWSHNAPEETAQLLCGYRYLGALPASVAQIKK